MFKLPSVSTYSPAFPLSFTLVLSLAACTKDGDPIDSGEATGSESTEGDASGEGTTSSSASSTTSASATGSSAGTETGSTQESGAADNSGTVGGETDTSVSEGPACTPQGEMCEPDNQGGMCCEGLVCTQSTGGFACACIAEGDPCVEEIPCCPGLQCMQSGGGSSCAQP